MAANVPTIHTLTRSDRLKRALVPYLWVLPAALLYTHCNAVDMYGRHYRISSACHNFLCMATLLSR